MNRICATLAAAQKQYVDFDATNPEHIEAFKLLCLDPSHSKQHAVLRFNIEMPFEDVRSMMFQRVSEQFMKLVSKKAPVAELYQPLPNYGR